MSEGYGRCALCGKECKLSYEHIPPEKAFNDRTAKRYSGLKILLDKGRMPWDVQGMRYVPMQRGTGLYSLCNDCNNKTGSWYANTYIEIAHVIAEALHESKKNKMQGIKIINIYAARFAKQILSMFCSINNSKFLQSYINQKIEDYEEDQSTIVKSIIGTKRGMKQAAVDVDELRKFVLNKNAIGIDKNKFKICMYITESNIFKLSGIMAAASLDKNEFVIISEITAWPLGFVLYFNPPDNLKFEGVDITGLTDLSYDDKVNIEFPFVVKEMNTILPLDYRSKEQIEKDVAKSSKA